MDWTPGETFKHHQGESRRREEERVEIKTDFTCLMELRDLEDELSMIGRLLDDQSACVCKLIDYFRLLQKPPKGLMTLEGVRDTIAVHQKTVEELKQKSKESQIAVRISDLSMYTHSLTLIQFKDLLEFKESKASFDEAREATYESKIMTTQNRSVMVFTVFTVIFVCHVISSVSLRRTK